MTKIQVISVLVAILYVAGIVDTIGLLVTAFTGGWEVWLEAYACLTVSGWTIFLLKMEDRIEVVNTIAQGMGKAFH